MNPEEKPMTVEDWRRLTVAAHTAANFATSAAERDALNAVALKCKHRRTQLERGIVTP